MKERLIKITGKLTEKIVRSITGNTTANMARRRAMAAVLACCAAFGWWGAVYPQFTLLSGTYRIVDETEKNESDAAGAEKDSMIDKGALYWQILGADQDHIRIKSRLWEDWKALWGAERGQYGSGEE